MSTNITFLGTSSMVPTKNRNHSALYVEYEGEGILFDCGEGTQRQLRFAGLKASKIRKLIISHWHGDHTLGIPGLIQTMGNNEYTGKLEIYGPKGTKQFMEHIMKGFVFACKVDFVIHEIEKNGLFIETNRYSIEAHSLQHKTKTFGFKFIEKDRRRINLVATKKLGIPEGPLLGKLQKGKAIEWKGKKIEAKELTTNIKGKSLGIIADTSVCKNCNVIAENVTVLISEATFTHDLAEDAKEKMHLTAVEAAQIAKDNNVKKLVLTHLSQRYKTPDKTQKEARSIFTNAFVAKDFMKITL